MTNAQFDRLLCGAAAQLREERLEQYRAAAQLAETAPRPRRRMGKFGLLWAAVLLCALSAAAFAAKPLFFYRLAFRNAEWTEITLAVSDAASGASSARQFCSLNWVPPVFSECSMIPIEGGTGVYDLTMKRGEKVLSVCQTPCDAFVLFGSAETMEAVRGELEGMMELPAPKGRLYFGLAEEDRLTALLLREGNAVFVSGNIDQRSFLKFVQNIDF